MSNSAGMWKSKIQVSVVIPAFRCAQYIEQAVESVLQQSFDDYELIVVNDGSPDTRALEAELERYSGRLRYLKQARGGPGSARNAGILKARGNYIAFLDGDDYWAPDHLAKQMDLIQKTHGLDLAYCDCVLLQGDKPVSRAFKMEPQSAVVDFNSLVDERCAISTSSAVVSREALLREGMFDESFLRCEDFDMWLRLAFAGARMAYHLDAQVFHRLNDAGLSADRLAMKQARIQVYQKLDATLRVSPEQRRAIRQQIANTETECHLEEMKNAVAEGDYAAALEWGDRVQRSRRSFRFRFLMFALRTAPRIFRRVYLWRARLLKDGRHERPAQEAFEPGMNQRGDGVDAERQASLVNQGSAHSSERRI
jgi:glycosyltransferase involved in cell wall biosynthesis